MTWASTAVPKFVPEYVSAFGAAFLSLVLSLSKGRPQAVSKGAADEFPADRGITSE